MTSNSAAFMNTPRPDSPEIDSLNLSVVRNDLIFRVQRRVGLIPPHGLGTVRRAIFWSLFAWLPIAAWTWYQGRISPPTADESPLAHFALHARLLVALPLFILGAWRRRVLPRSQQCKTS